MEGRSIGVNVKRDYAFASAFIVLGANAAQAPFSAQDPCVWEDIDFVFCFFNSLSKTFVFSQKHIKTNRMLVSPKMRSTHSDIVFPVAIECCTPTIMCRGNASVRFIWDHSPLPRCRHHHRHRRHLHLSTSCHISEAKEWGRGKIQL